MGPEKSVGETGSESLYLNSEPPSVKKKGVIRIGHRDKTYQKEAYGRLRSMLSIGRKKHMDKSSHGGPGTRDRIYSWSTYHAYRRWVGTFLDYCRENGRPTDLASCRQYAEPWIRSMAEGGKYSAWTLNLARSAVAKLFGESGDQIAPLPPRRREDITRSRGGVAMDNRIRDEWRPLMDFCRATGLRRHELEKLRGTDLSQPPGVPPRLEVRGKGGKVRSAPVVGDPGAVQAVVEACISAGGGLVWPEVPEKLDIHSLRAEYAEVVYRAAERPLGSLKGHELYHCRGDRTGIAYDREALRAASTALGHRRVSVVADHYLWKFEDNPPV